MKFQSYNKIIFGWLVFANFIIISGCPGGAPVSGPNAVSGLKAEAGNRHNILKWDEVLEADSYSIYYSTEPGVDLDDEKISNVATTSYEHSGLVNGVKYFYIVTAQNEDGESEKSLEVTAMPVFDNDFSAILVSSEAQDSDNFGFRVDVDGDYAVVSALGEDGGPGDPAMASGAVYVYHRLADGDWGVGVRLSASDPQASDQFGFSVSIQGDYVVVGAPAEDGGSGDPMLDSGTVYVFRRTGDNTWSGPIKLRAPDAQAGDRFGLSVAIHGDYIIVGAPFEAGGSGDPMASAGAAYVFRRIGVNSWDNGIKLVADDAQSGDVFGFSVDIHGAYAVVGAPSEDGGNTDPVPNAGAVYVFHRTGETGWDTGSKLVSLDLQEGDVFGYSVSMGENHVGVGAPFEDNDSSVDSDNFGAAYVFARQENGQWTQYPKLTAKTSGTIGDFYGFSVAVDAGFLAVGAPLEDGGAGDPLISAGAVYVYHLGVDDTWQELVTLSAGADAQAADQFGNSVSIGNSYILVGASAEDGGSGDPIPDSGSVYIF